MRVVLQRVARASVTVEDHVVGSIGRGFLLLVGFAAGDGEEQIRWMADKIVGLRVFADEEGRMNRDVLQVGGALLVVSQFTLYADARKGRRPSFVGAAQPDEAESHYEKFVHELEQRELPVATGEFGALMSVELVNDGPVTLILDR
jgi:D-tyrosyl-tRNA(Tyr) deacylase